MSFQMDLGDELQEMLKSMDMLDDNINLIAVEAMESAGEIVADEQKRLIQNKYPTLASCIKKGKIYVTKNKGRFTISVGYDSNAIIAHPESVIVEFGKPSENRHRKKVETGRKVDVFVPSKRERDGGHWKTEKEKLVPQNKEGKLLDSKGRIIGYVEPKSHIRKGFDNVKEKALESCIEMIKEKMEW